MLTVIIEAGAEQSAIGATLATLIPGAIEGIVREVVLIDRKAAPAIRKVADHAGCRLVTDGDLATIVTSARGEWLLLLEAGARPSADWIEAVTGHVIDVGEGQKGPQAARFRSAGPLRGVWFRRLFRRRTALADGLLISKRQGLGAARNRATLEEMAQGLATTRLDASIRPPSAISGQR